MTDFKKYLPIYLLTLVNVIGFTLLIPILPGIVRTYVAEEYVSFGYGLLLSLYAGFQFLAGPFLGSLSDVYGRRKLLFFSQLGTALSWIVFAAAYFIPSEAEIFGLPLALIVIGISRITDGITGGNVSVANAWVSDITKPERKTKVFGQIGALFGLGFLFGPALGGYTIASEYGYLLTGGVAFLISFVTLIFIYFYLPESLPKSKRDTRVDASILDDFNIFKQLKGFKNQQLIWDLALLRTFFSIVFATYTTIIILIYESEFGISSLVLGFLLSLIGIFSFVNQAYVGPALASKLGDARSIYVSFIILFFSLALIPFIPSGQGSINAGFWLLTINAYFLNIGISLGMPTFKTLFSKSVSERKQGKIIGIDESLLSFGNSVAPILSGFIYVFLYRNIFFLFALLLAVPFLILYFRDGKVLLELEKSNAD